MCLVFKGTALFLLTTLPGPAVLANPYPSAELEVMENPLLVGKGGTSPSLDMDIFASLSVFTEAMLYRCS